MFGGFGGKPKGTPSFFSCFFGLWDPIKKDTGPYAPPKSETCVNMTGLDSHSHPRDLAPHETSKELFHITTLEASLRVVRSDATQLTKRCSSAIG